MVEGQKSSDFHPEDLICESINSGEFFRNPYPLFAYLRTNAPVFKSELIGGWILTRHADIDSVLRNHEDFSSKGRVLYLLDQLPEPTRSNVTLLRQHFATGLAHSDDPEHRRLRSLLSKAFTPKMIESFRPRVRQVADKYFQSFSGEVDLISELLTPLPARIVGAILGSVESDIPSLIRWAHAINGLYERGGRIGEPQAINADNLLEEMRAFVMELVATRRKQFTSNTLDPNQDILSGLVAAEIDGDRLSEQELLSTMVTLFVAGHETTTHLLGNGLIAVLSRPEVFELMRNDQSLIPQVVEEMARFDGSVPRSWRIAKHDLEISGNKISAGELVLPLLAAANRDPEVFPNPDEFDPSRDTKKHLAYGKGVHVCLGAPLARVEAQEILYSMLTNCPQLQLATDPNTLQWREDMALRGLISLPVKV